jgi:ABC-type branched-subunit amino acid transport system ATPase component
VGATSILVLLGVNGPGRQQLKQGFCGQAKATHGAGTWA